MNVVIDTNVYISALLFGNIPEKVVSYCYNYLDVYISIDIINEIQEILSGKFLFRDKEIKDIMGVLISQLKIIIPETKIGIFEKNGDNNILECALASDSKYIISGDKKHLLKLKEYKGILIVSPAKFYKLVA